MSLTGIPFWCVSVGIIAAGELVLGIIYDPLVGELYSARKGGGALMNGHPMRASGETDAKPIIATKRTLVITAARFEAQPAPRGVTLDCGASDRVWAAVGSFDVDDIVEPVEPFGEPARQAMLW